MARLPTFLVIGAMKAGTTSLRDYLQTHPQVFLPDRELHYFVAAENFDRGVEWYEQQFAAAGDVIAIGDKSPTYAMRPEHPGVPERVAALLPDVRLIYVLRDPIARIRSHYLHNRAGGGERRSFAEAVAVDRRYVDTSRYSMQLDSYREHFSNDQILVLTSDELDAEPEATVARVAAFIGADPTWRPPNIDQRSHRSDEKRLPSTTATRLRHVPGARTLANLAPTALRRKLVAAGSRPIRPDDALIDADLRAWLVDELADDVTSIRSWLGPSFDGWGIG